MFSPRSRRVGRLIARPDDFVEREAALRRTCCLQMRPVLMTCIAACVGPLRLPILFLNVLPSILGTFSRRRVLATSEA